MQNRERVAETREAKANRGQRKAPFEPGIDEAPRDDGQKW
jgi:hypothetical protein